MRILRIVTLQGGPLDGRKHSIMDGMGDGREPGRIGLWEDGQKAQTDATVGRAWYKRDGQGTYRYERTVSVQ